MTPGRTSSAGDGPQQAPPGWRGPAPPPAWPGGGGPVWLGTIGLAVASGAVSPGSAWVLRELIDQLSRPGPDLGLIEALAAASVLLSAFGLALGSLSALTAAACQRTISVAVTADLSAAVNRIQGLSRFERPAFQDQLRLAERAAEETPAGLSAMFGSALQGTATIAGYTGILLATWPPMVALLAAAALPTAVAQLSLIRRSARTSEAMMSRYRKWFLLRGLLSDPKAVMESRLLGLGEFFRSRLVTALHEATGGEYAVHRRIAGTQSGLSVLGGAITAAGAAVVAAQAARGRLSLGDLVMFLAAVSGTQAVLVATISQSLSLGASLRLLRHYAAVLGAGPDLPVSGPRPVAVPPLRRGIELRDVWFGYQPGGWVLRGVSADLPCGQAVGLVGRNGRARAR